MSDAIPIAFAPIARSRRALNLRALFWKEWRESRPLLIAGLWTYWLMPVLLGIIYLIVFERSPDVFSQMTWALMIALGWFYAVICGAHVVARDWGRAEEHFLRAQPIGAGSIVIAKFCAGLLVLLALIVLTGLTGWAAGFTAATQLSFTTGLGALTATGVMLAGFGVAFTVAVGTRQMLPSVLAGALGVALWWLGPYLARSFEFVQPEFMRAEGRVVDAARLVEAYEQVVAFLTVCALFLAGCLLVSVYLAQRERAIRISGKGLAWGMVVVLLGAFGVVMGEVGSTLEVRDLVALPALPAEAWTLAERPKCSSHAGTAFLLSQNSFSRLPATRFEVAPAGRLQHVSNEQLFDLVKTEFSQVIDWEAKSSDELVLTQTTFLSPELVRSRIHWPADAKPSIISQQKCFLPKDVPPVYLIDAVTTDRYAYLLVSVFEPNSLGERTPQVLDAVNGWSNSHILPLSCLQPDGTVTECYHRMLYVYDWQYPGQPKPLYSLTTISRPLRMCLIAGRLVLYERFRDSNAWDAAPFDPDRPEEVIRGAESIKPTAKGLLPSVKPFWRNLVNSTVMGLGTSYPREANQWGYLLGLAYDPARGLLFGSSRQAFEVRDDNEALIGEYRFNLLAQALRGQGERVTLLPNKYVVEMGNTVMSVLDVSNPQQPRRVGFLNLAMPVAPEVFPVGGHLALIEGRSSNERRSLTILDLPKP